MLKRIWLIITSHLLRLWNLARLGQIRVHPMRILMKIWWKIAFSTTTPCASRGRICMPCITQLSYRLSCAVRVTRCQHQPSQRVYTKSSSYFVPRRRYVRLHISHLWFVRDDFTVHEPHLSFLADEKRTYAVIVHQWFWVGYACSSAHWTILENSYADKGGWTHIIHSESLVHD